MPRVFESHDLRIGFHSALVFEKHVVVAVRVERRVEIYKIDAACRDTAAEYSDYRRSKEYSLSEDDFTLKLAFAPNVGKKTRRCCRAIHFETWLRLCTSIVCSAQSDC
jgi:hypothetical protein